MRRSLLFIPANTPSMMQNADVFEADAVIFDLEDAVQLTEKDAAVDLFVQFLNQFKLKDVEIIVRINGLDTPFGEQDLYRVVSNQIDSIMLPKATVQSTAFCEGLIRKIEKKRKMTKMIRIIPIIERAVSVIEAYEIASFERVDGLLLGAEDLATDLEVERTEQGTEILFARSMVIMAAKANGIDAIDTPYTSTNNLLGLETDARFAKSLGMNAKACIHPNQIDTVNQIFCPSIEAIRHAKRIIEAEQEAIKQQRGAFSVDGKMVDKPIIERARKVLEKAKQWHL
jgi:citrate lyase subunit beta / citryl-CoA lyase